MARVKKRVADTVGFLEILDINAKTRQNSAKFQTQARFFGEFQERSVSSAFLNPRARPNNISCGS